MTNVSLGEAEKLLRGAGGGLELGRRSLPVPLPARTGRSPGTCCRGPDPVPRGLELPSSCSPFPNPASGPWSDQVLPSSALLSSEPQVAAGLQLSSAFSDGREAKGGACVHSSVHCPRSVRGAGRPEGAGVATEAAGRVRAWRGFSRERGSGGGVGQAGAWVWRRVVNAAPAKGLCTPHLSACWSPGSPISGPAPC